MIDSFTALIIRIVLLFIFLYLKEHTYRKSYNYKQIKYSKLKLQIWAMFLVILVSMIPFLGESILVALILLLLIMYNVGDDIVFKTDNRIMNKIIRFLTRYV